MEKNDLSSDSSMNQPDSLDSYMESLVESNGKLLNTSEICYNDHENEAHFDEFYDKLKREKEKVSEESSLYVERKEVKANTNKVIAPTVSANQISSREHKKDIYIPDDEVNSMTLEECVEYKKMLNIETFGTRVPKPISSFLQLSKCVPKAILNRIEKMGFYQPTPVQCQAIPCILQGRNTIILSETGSGKTISYLIPVLVQVLDLIKQWRSVAEKRTVYAVVLTLTRELCYQVYSLVVKLCKNINLRIAHISTGIDKTEMFRSMVSGCEIAVCTPARLVDLIALKGVNLSECKYFVVDEADKMFTREYESQTISLLNLIRDDTLTVFVSASTTDEIHKKIKSLVRNAITVKVGVSEVINLEKIELKFMTMFSVNEVVQKKTWLEENLRNFNSQVIIFCNTRDNVEQIYRFLQPTFRSCCMLHGDMLPVERYESISGFKEGKFNFLIATDVVGRGIDIPAVGCVINYDAPKHFHTFLHRVGRCGRANTKGVGFTLFTKNDNKLAAYILYYLQTELKRGKVKLEIPEHLKKFAMTFGPFRKAKQSGVDFLEYMARGSMMNGGDKREKNKRRIDESKNTRFVSSKQARVVSKESVTTSVYGEESQGGREYNATDEISSSSEEE